MTEGYATEGTFYTAPTMTGTRGLVAFDYADYEGMLAAGVLGQEVRATLQRAAWGDEYPEGAPVWEGRAGLYAITIEGVSDKPQLDIAEGDVAGVLARGLRDGDRVRVGVFPLPYAAPRSASYDDLRLGDRL